MVSEMINFQEFSESIQNLGSKLDGIENKLDVSLLDEAGNISSAIGMRKHSKIYSAGRRLYGDRNATSSEKLLAKMLVDLAGLVMLSVAVSGKGSAMSNIAKASSLKGL